MARTFVVGLDGGSWRLVEPWVQEGDLPNLATLRQTGTWAAHRSCLPPVTFPNWKCYSSGKNPGKFGVYWWERIDMGAGRIDVMNGADFRTAELWDYLNEAGFSSGVVNMPSMYPPRDIDGPIVAGGPDAVDGEYRSIGSGFTTPSTLERRLIEEYDYRVHPDPLLSSDRERGGEVEEILSLLDLRFEVALDLFLEQDLDFMHVTLFYLNVLQHFFWDDRPTRRAWTRVDEWLGRLANLDGVNLIVMSDHGSAPTTTEFYINEWLAKQGYLIKRKTVDSYLRSAGLTREAALSLAKRLGVVELLADLVPERVQQHVPQAAGAKRERKMDGIVLEETAALASGQGPIYINPEFDVGTIRDQLIQELRTVTDSEGEPLFDAVRKGETVYSGPYTDLGPDIVIDQRPGVHVNDGLGGSRIQTAPDRWAAENTPHGIFVARGPDYDALGRIEEISILDIAPTILATYGSPIPSDCDGTVLPIVSGDPEVETRPPIEVGISESRAANDAVANRLSQLGYME